MKHLFPGLLLLASVVFFGPAWAEENVRPMDLDDNGVPESQVHFEGEKITRVESDKNFDKKIDATIRYKDGFRDKAEIDSDFDGVIDTWIEYYITGRPSVIEMDKNRDGKPDRFKYFKNDYIYKREWDKNFDGLPDSRFIYQDNPDRNSLQMETVEKQVDVNYDGVFDRSVMIEKKVPILRVGLAPGSNEEMMTT